MDFMPIILMAVIVEGLITYLQHIVKRHRLHWQMILSIAIGIFCSVSYDLDLFSLLGLESDIPYVGSVLTGILISRGSNYLFDLIKQMGGLVGDPGQTEKQPKNNSGHKRDLK